MNKKSVALFVVAAMAALAFATGDTATPDDKDITAVIEHYFNGAKTAQAGPFEKAWHLEQGRMVHVRNKDGVESMVSTPIAEAIKNWTSKPAEESWGKILSIDAVDGRMAVVKVELLWRKNVYIDFLSLLKIDGAWKIVNKTFVSRGEPKPAP